MRSAHARFRDSTRYLTASFSSSLSLFFSSSAFLLLFFSLSLAGCPYLVLHASLLRMLPYCGGTSFTRRKKFRIACHLPDTYYIRDKYIESGVVLSHPESNINFAIRISVQSSGERRRHRSWLSHVKLSKYYLFVI